MCVGMAGHITRNPNPESEKPEPEPEEPEPEKPDPYFGFETTVPEIIMGKSGSRSRYPNYPNNPKIYPTHVLPFSPAHQYTKPLYLPAPSPQI